MVSGCEGAALVVDYRSASLAGAPGITCRRGEPLLRPSAPVAMPANRKQVSTRGTLQTAFFSAFYASSRETFSVLDVKTDPYLNTYGWSRPVNTLTSI